jgi:hypothetical protein
MAIDTFVIVFPYLKIQYRDDVERLQFVIPFAFFRLLPNGKGRIIQTPVHKMLLFRNLHLDDELLVFTVCTVNVKYRPSLAC